jgi:hypothetical protein
MRLAAVALACVLAGGVVTHGQRAPRGDAAATASPEWLQRLRTWSRAITDHVPGRSDLALVELAAWSADDVKTVVDDYLALRRQLRGRGDGAEFEHKDYRLTAGELRELAVFSSIATDSNATIKRAAVVHADVALLAALDWSRSTGAPDSVQVVDGVVVGYDSPSSHWVVARRMLDAVEPSPEQDPFVARWYNAVAAALIETRNFSSAKPHLEHGLELLPRDARLHLQAGCYHQASAGPTVLSVLRMQQRLADRVPLNKRAGLTLVGTPQFHWKNAERQLREAVTLDPDLVEARVRLGLALLQLDRPDDAAVELRRAVAGKPDGEPAYFAHLLLGQAEERLGHDQAADASYERAAAIRPDARSPRLARVAIARRNGDRDGAWRDLRALIMPPVTRQTEVDPWWQFYRWQVTTGKALMDEVRASLPREAGK